MNVNQTIILNKGTSLKFEFLEVAQAKRPASQMTPKKTMAVHFSMVMIQHCLEHNSWLGFLGFQIRWTP